MAKWFVFTIIAGRLFLFPVVVATLILVKLRHSRVSFTSDYYQHVTKDMIDEPADVMNDMFGKKGLENGLEK